MRTTQHCLEWTRVDFLKSVQFSFLTRLITMYYWFFIIATHLNKPFFKFSIAIHFFIKKVTTFIHVTENSNLWKNIHPYTRNFILLELELLSSLDMASWYCLFVHLIYVCYFPLNYLKFKHIQFKTGFCCLLSTLWKFICMLLGIIKLLWSWSTSWLHYYLMILGWHEMLLYYGTY